MKKTLLLFFSLLFCMATYAQEYEYAYDELTLKSFGVPTGTSYVTFSDVVGQSGTVYAGQIAGGNDAIQMRSNNSNSGIVTTKSVGYVEVVHIDWNSNTDESRVLNVYGKDTPYEDAADLYDTSKAGTLLAQIEYSYARSELFLDLRSQLYSYIGFRSNNGALYIDQISIDWALAEDENPDTGGDNHGYSPNDPFSVSEVIALAETMSEDDTESGVYVKGYVSEIGSFYSNYGDLDYYISDDGTTTNQFYVYNGYYLNGDKFTSDDQIKVGDEVIVTGDLVNYKGNTPELSRGNYIYSLNGETSDGGGDGDGGETGGVTISGTTITMTNTGVTVGTETATILLTDLGLENSESVDGRSFTMSDNSTITFAQNDGNNPPAWYDNGASIRMYARNTLTFACSKQIAKIEVTCNSANGTDYVGNATATVEFSETGAVYCNYQESTSGGTQMRPQSIVVYYAEDSGTETGITSLETNTTNDGATYNLAGQRVSDSYQGVVIKNGRKFLKK